MNALDEAAEADAWNHISPEAVRFVMQEAGRRGILPQKTSDCHDLAETLCLSMDGSLTLSGAILLCKRPDRYVLGSYVRIGLFDSEGDPVKEDVVRGPLIMQPAAAIRMLFDDYIESKVVYKNLFIDSTTDYPKKPVEEAVLNACVHKDFLQECPVEIRIYPDRLMVMNRGGLPEGWGTDDLLKDHVSRPRNVRIADTFRDLGLMGCWGTGIRRMIQGCGSAGIPSPIFECDGDGFSVTFLMESAERPENPDPPEPSLEERILEIISNGELRTGQEISDAVGVNRRQFTRIMSGLMESGAVSREGNRRKGRWVVRRRSLRILYGLQKATERRLRGDQVRSPS